MRLSGYCCVSVYAVASPTMPAPMMRMSVEDITSFLNVNGLAADPMRGFHERLRQGRMGVDRAGDLLGR